MGNKIHNEIADLAPMLASLEKQNPFTVPKGYFTSLEHRTLDAIDKKPNLIATTPEGYFDTLSDKVMEKIQEEKATKVVPLFRMKWVAVAASFLVLLCAGYLMNTNSGIQSDDAGFAMEIEPEEALDYLIENENLYLSDLISLELYADDLEEDEANFMEFDDADIDELLNELDQEDLEELL